jgi:hypothetical protein
MSQHDYVIENQTFPATRTDLNNAFGAIVSQNSGASAPSTTYAYQLWYDTSTNKLKQRNSDNDAWIDLFDVNQTTDVATPSAAGVISGIVDNSTATAITIDSSNDITLSGGIYVGGTGSANYLDDYEEGTFTAQMFDASSGGNASSTTNTGYYTKIGQLVSVTFSLLNISTAGLTGTVAYFTLPFTASATKGRGSGAVRLDTVTFGGGRTQAVADVGEGESRCRMLIFGDGLTDQSITVSDFNGTSSDVAAFSLVYITDS